MNTLYLIFFLIFLGFYLVLFLVLLFSSNVDNRARTRDEADDDRYEEETVRIKP